MDIDNNKDSQIKVSDWLIIYLIMCIPIVNIIMLFNWAFSASGNSTRSKWAKANLILLAVIVSVYLFFFIIFGMSYFFNT